MFSSTYDSNSFLTFPSSSYPTTLPPCFIDAPDENGFANNNTFLHDPLVVPFIPTATTHHHDHAPFSEETVANLQAVADCTAMLEQDASNNGYAAVHYGSINPNFLTQKPAIAKKDRHSKIHTSQGLRDRRVRLSSDVARKFFDLQDMLEFDKPSNTLEWLFTKSENAIKELARSSKHSRCSGGDKCSCDQPHGVLDTSNEKSLAASGGDASNKGRKLKCAQREDVCVQTKKESREKARARARERTCYKMCSSTGLEERCPATANTTQILHQLMRPSIIQPEHEAACAIWPHQMPQPYPYPHQLVASSESPCRDHGFNVIEESIMIKRNMKPSLMSSSHNQNLVIPKEANFNNIDYHSFPYPTPNWDTNGDFNNGNSNFCGIATMNLSSFFMNQW